MKAKTRQSIASAILILFLIPAFVYSQSGYEFRRSSVMRGNLVKCVFANQGVIGQPSSKGARGAWIYENNGYIGDVSPMVGAEVTVDGKTFHSVAISPASRPATGGAEQSPSGKAWGFEPVSGYFNENQEGIALYSDPDSWPGIWPDKLTDSEDPGWPGSWNGIFGKQTTASEECFFVMDDNNDEEFNNANYNEWNVAFKPDSTDPTKNGLGLQVRVRGMQWSDFLAQDCIFWVYEITNTSTTDYDKVVFGMLVGTYLGTTSTDDSHQEYDDDYSFFDVEKDLTYTGDFDDDCSRNPRWTGDVGMVGYAFLESPGNPYDGIDNDGDADESLLFPGTGPYFEAEDFDERVIQPGDEIVLISQNYERTVVRVGNEEATYQTRGMTKPVTIIPGVTRLSEGNVLTKDGVESINSNAYDGIDNDFDGLIDENFYLHYRQVRKDQSGNVLIDKLNPVRHKDYINGIGLDDGLIDERRNDGIDNDGDWNAESDDVGADGLMDTNDRGEGDGIPTAGEPNFDQTDVDESDQIGLTSFDYFTPSSEIAVRDDEELWQRLAPGFFDVPESIVNNKPERGEDGDFMYGSGYFPLRAGETQYFSLALVYGEGGGAEMDTEDLLKNRETVQQIYDSDYRFPPAPDTPTLTAVAGDGQVTLYWDRKAEKSFDPVLKEYDFEGYKIYKATDNNFNEIMTITDADGIPIFRKPLVQFDLNNEISGYFRPSAELYQDVRGASFYLGDDTGLQHSYVDTDVENGRRYYYAIVAYDRGDEEADIFPKENSMRIDIETNGDVRTFQNTAVVVPNAEVVGYTPPEGSVLVAPETAVGTGQLYYNVVDETAQTGHDYRVEFFDTANDGIDNDYDWDPTLHDVGSDGVAETEDADGTEGNGEADAGEPNVDQLDTDETYVPVTTSYSVLDVTGVRYTFSAKDTFTVNLQHKNIVENSVRVTDNEGEAVAAENYILDVLGGRIKGSSSGSLRYGDTYTIYYQYYPVYRSGYIQRSPYESETKDTYIFDGIQLAFNNHWTIQLDTLKSGWSNPEKGYSYNFNVIDTYFDEDRLLGLRHPSDYRIEFYDEVADTSFDMRDYFIFGVPSKFKVFNITDNRYIDYVFVDINGDHAISPFDEVVFVEPEAENQPVFTWDLFFTSTEDTIFTHGTGDTLSIRLKKPFRRGDTFEFTTILPGIDEVVATDEMDRIKVVPNPYVVATTHELPLAPAITSGRGERKVEFIHLPAGATIHIFTSRGEHVITLNHDEDIHDGTVAWNLKTKENLDVASGIYFYVVESSVGVKRGKLALIK